MPIPESQRNALRRHLAVIYGGRAEDALEQLEAVIQRNRPTIEGKNRRPWSERDIVLITYADQIRGPVLTPLHDLHKFLRRHDLFGTISTIHLLPFFPYSSDDGFSVIDYRQVDPQVGIWRDVERLGGDVQLMFDLVLNHVSPKSHWFGEYRQGSEPYTNWFIEVDPGADLSAVTRPRSTPLLTQVETSRGSRHVWTTFGDDQIDLNFANPQVLAEVVDILLFYVEKGARIIRLDAIAYLWKRIGTSCIHLPESHEVVKLMRSVLDSVAPGTLLLTETNVPHEENVSYFGHGDEAHMVYQFSLPPLLLDALLTGDAHYLVRWLANLQQPEPGMTFFNFTASHDGVGVRPLEGLVPPERVDALADAARARGGHVSTRRRPDGTEAPYELNISYFDALGEPSGLNPQRHARRFLASQLVMLALRGIPGVYFHSLVATPNDHAGVEQTSRARSINRHKFSPDELEAAIVHPGSAQQIVFDAYRRALSVRICQPAFHPEAEQIVFVPDDPALVAFCRTSLDGGQKIQVLANTSDKPLEVDLAALGMVGSSRDLLAEAESPLIGERLTLGPWQVAWLECGEC